MNHTIQALSPFDAAAILIVLAAALGYVNHRFFRLPASVGLTVMGAIASMIVIAVDHLMPTRHLSDVVVAFLSSIDFHTTLMDGMLSFLLFAGALHVDWAELRRARLAIFVLSTVGVLISTALVGGGFWLLSQWLGLNVPLVWCMVFGALISPTDPVAVMAVLQRAAVPPTLRAVVAGESLFNDGVGVVVFTIVVASALGVESFSVSTAATVFLMEAGGGVVLGAVVGWIAFRAMESIDEYSVEVMISLAVVMGGYSLAHWIHVSGPVAMAVAGLIIGNHGVAHAMSDVTRDYLIKFWALIDEILNAVLFLLIGLEVIAIAPGVRVVVLGSLCVALVVLARYISVVLPLTAMRSVISLGRLGTPTLVWGGLRGGISVALALSLPESPVRTTILAATYVVVMFAVIVQGGTVGLLIKRLGSSSTSAADAHA
ncbi:MAG: sodium:proton antiporter [Gemmatimonas sp.]